MTLCVVEPETGPKPPRWSPVYCRRDSLYHSWCGACEGREAPPVGRISGPMLHRSPWLGNESLNTRRHTEVSDNLCSEV